MERRKPDFIELASQQDQQPRPYRTEGPFAPEWRFDLPLERPIALERGRNFVYGYLVGLVVGVVGGFLLWGL